MQHDSLGSRRHSYTTEPILEKGFSFFQEEIFPRSHLSPSAEFHKFLIGWSCHIPTSKAVSGKQNDVMVLFDYTAVIPWGWQRGHYPLAYGRKNIHKNRILQTATSGGNGHFLGNLTFHSHFLKFIYLFMAVLGLRFCTGFSLVVVSRDSSQVAVLRLLIVVASLVVEYGF